ncbi:MAG: glycosyltransferase, partial [Pseudomonadota bacterium]
SRPDWLPEDGRKTLLFLGRLHPKKGADELLRGWAQLAGESPGITHDWRLVLAGWDDGGHAAELHALARELGLEDILFPGALHGEEKDKAFAHADAFILPSHSEGLPMGVLEAWAWGLPVFMTDACNLPEGFRERAAMRIIPEASDIAGVLGTGLALNTLDEWGERGRTLASSRFAWTPIAEQHIEVYEWMLRGDGETPRCVRLGPA